MNRSEPAYSNWTRHLVIPGQGHPCLAPGCQWIVNTDVVLCGPHARRVGEQTAIDIEDTWRYYLRDALSSSRWQAYERLANHVRERLAGDL